MAINDKNVVKWLYDDSDSLPEVSPDEDARYPRDMTSTLLTSTLTADVDANVGGSVSHSSTVTSLTVSLTQHRRLLFTLEFSSKKLITQKDAQDVVRDV